jgi:hypothetical protein
VWVYCMSKRMYRLSGLLVLLAVLVYGLLPPSSAQTGRDLPLPTDDPDMLTLVERLRDTPLLSNLYTETTVEIFQRGQELGNRPYVFTKVGDSDTTSGDFLQPFGIRQARYCTLGPYADLAETVAYYSISPRENVRNSWVNPSVAAVNGLTSAAAMDSFWARHSPHCRANEGTLACEYRLVRPGVAVIMLGRMDVLYYEADFYREMMTDVIEFSMEQGVIPVLTTFVVLPDIAEWEKSIVFNNILVDLAEEFEIPLINLWGGAETLPQHGIGPDRTHLSHAVDHFCDFTGSQHRYGGTLRNLLTLQALDALRQGILDE